MAKAKSKAPIMVPKVRLVQVGDRTPQVRYRDATTGKEVRISTGTHDPRVAESVRDDIEARLRLGLDPRPSVLKKPDRLKWDQFREEYRRLELDKKRDPDTPDYKLAVVEKVARPKYLDDLLDPEKLLRLETELSVGRSPHTVNSIMRALKAGINWAHRMGWVDRGCQWRQRKTPKKKSKGRPLTDAEFKLMLDAAHDVCPNDPAGWKFFLRGLVASGLRIGEAFAMTWDDPDTVRPVKFDGHVMLAIPGHQQKSGESSVIPTIPEFAKLLDSVPDDERTGYVLNRPRFGASGGPQTSKRRESLQT